MSTYSAPRVIPTRRSLRRRLIVGWIRWRLSFGIRNTERAINDLALTMREQATELLALRDAGRGNTARAQRLAACRYRDAAQLLAWCDDLKTLQHLRSELEMGA